MTFDNVLVRSGLGASHAIEAAYRHRHFKVNGKSGIYLPLHLKLVTRSALKRKGTLEVKRPSWLSVDANTRILKY